MKITIDLDTRGKEHRATITMDCVRMDLDLGVGTVGEAMARLGSLLAPLVDARVKFRPGTLGAVTEPAPSGRAAVQVAEAATGDVVTYWSRKRGQQATGRVVTIGKRGARKGMLKVRPAGRRLLEDVRLEDVKVVEREASAAPGAN